MQATSQPEVDAVEDSTQCRMVGRILVIDDNEAIHADFRKILAPECQVQEQELQRLDVAFFGESTADPNDSSCYELLFATQGKDGYELLKRETEAEREVQVAFVDMRMPPGWDGTKTIEKLWQIAPNLQTVICTAYSDKNWQDITKQLGNPQNLLILKKPFDTVEVRQLAESLCAKWWNQKRASNELDTLAQELEDQRAELSYAHEDAEQLIQSIENVMISLDGDSRVCRWNRAASETFGIAQEDAVGVPFARLPITWQDPTNFDALFNAVRSETLTHIELPFVDADGHVTTLGAQICPICHSHSSDGWLILATDVTQQKMLRAQLDQAQRLESVGQLAAGVAHEINTPMQYIGDNVRYVSKSLAKLKPICDVIPALIENPKSDENIALVASAIDALPPARKVRSLLEQIPEALQDAMQGVANVSKIVAAMKEFSHPGNDERAMVSINHVLDSTITVAKNEWKYVADVETDLDPNLPSISAFQAS